jgi:sirohydrochlorin cobaltochelatase
VSQALVLFAHGARDPRWAEPFVQLRARLLERRPGLPIELAFLERMQPDLATACATLAAAGCTDILIVPVFLGQGGHVRIDLPAQIEAVRAAHPGVRIQACGAAGEDASVIDALAGFCIAQLAPVKTDLP